MADTNITPEQKQRLEQALERADSAGSHAEMMGMTAGEAVAAAAATKSEFCDLWPKLRGVLKFLAGLPIPGKYKAVLEQALKYGEAAYGALCGGH
jgi:hypothetical protein